jgi:hypothetical protein
MIWVLNRAVISISDLTVFIVRLQSPLSGSENAMKLWEFFSTSA